MALVCPLCGTTTSFHPAEITGNAVILSRSDADHTVRELASLVAVVDGDDHDPHYAVCQCQDCRRLFVAGRTAGTSGEWEAVYPLAAAAVPPELPAPVAAALEEAQKCLAMKAYSGCFLMCRATLGRVQGDFAVTNVKELHERGKVSTALFRQADEVTLWPHLIGHEDAPPDVLTDEACRELLGYLQELLHSLYVTRERLRKLREAITEGKK